MLRRILVLFVLTTFTTLCSAGDVCYNYNDGVLYCDWGCCGVGGNQSCCSFAVWIIVLSVIGGVCLIAVIICVVCMCICQKRARARAGGGMVIQTQTIQPSVIPYGVNTYPMTVQGETNQGFVVTK